MEQQKRKICFVITSKIHYSRNKLILEHLKNRDDVELQIVIGGSAILSKYGKVEKWLEDDGFDVHDVLYLSVEGGNTVSMAKTTGLSIVEFTNTFSRLDPDIVVVRADRFEVLGAAIAAAYLNKTVAHIEGGDLSGTIDESVRHAITKLSHVHFATNDHSYERILQLGELPKYVFNVGSPDVEFASTVDHSLDHDIIQDIGVGAKVNLHEPYLIVMQHPVTTEIAHNKTYTIETLEAIRALRMPTLWFWPNIDAGTDSVSNAIRSYRENYDLNEYVQFLKYIEPHRFIALLKNSACIIGNSSCAIKECSYLGVPAVNIGSRQQGRSMRANVTSVPHERDAIVSAVKNQLAQGVYPMDSFYYKEHSSKDIAEKLASIDLYIQKQFQQRSKNSE